MDQVHKNTSNMTRELEWSPINNDGVGRYVFFEKGLLKYLALRKQQQQQHGEGVLIAFFKYQKTYHP